MTPTVGRSPALIRLALFLVSRALIWLAWLLLPTPDGKAAISALVALDLGLLIAGLIWVHRADLLTPAEIWLQRLVLMIVAAFVLSTSLDRVALAYRTAPPPPPAPARLVVDGQTAVFVGPISLASYNALAETLRTTQDVTRLRLTSEGGHIPSARGMARLVKQAGLATEAAGTCASACTLVFIAGQNRHLLPGAKLGFHAYLLQTGANLLVTTDEEMRDRTFMANQGVAADFLDRAFATDHSTIWFPDAATLQQAGVLKD